MSQIDLQSLLRSARAQSEIKTREQAQRALRAQRVSAARAADAYAQELEKRAALTRSLTSNDMDAMRFRWLAEHSQDLVLLAGQTLDEMRKSIDLMIRQEAICRLAEMRREYNSARQAKAATL